MAELIKDQLSLENIYLLTEEISQQAPAYKVHFNQGALQQVLPKEAQWLDLSLMERLRAAAKALYCAMPECAGADVVIAALHNKNISAWLSLVCCEYVAINGNVSLEKGLLSLQKMTEVFSAEFAIRHYLLKHPEATLKVLKSWLKNKNYHVRRLISEGTRPRLPWGVRLPLFINHPDLVMPLLSALKDDEEEYVRRSVANHLNDIAKDHPQLVIATAKAWLADESLRLLTKQQQKNRTKLIRHACRTLLKQGDAGVLQIFGYLPASDVICTLSSNCLQVPFGGTFEFDLILEKQGEKESLLMIDYVIHFQKANGKTTAKVFKWLDRKIKKSTIEKVGRSHSFKKISTRKYYPGLHRLEVMVNGIKKAQIEFELLEE